MLKANIPIVGFDDRKLVLFGIPLIALMIPFLFFGLDFTYYRTIAKWEYLESLTYTFFYWTSTRYVMIVFRKKYPSFEDSWKRLLRVTLIVILLTPLISFTVTLLIRGIYSITGGADLFEPTTIQAFGATYFIQFAVVTLYEAIYFFYKYKEAILEKEQIQRAHLQGQLDNLRNQINPHFLFNSLNTLMNLIPTDSDRAMNYLSKLSKFYRYTVSKQETPLVNLQTELENIQIYIALLTERFQKGIEISLPEKVNPGAQILPLCLQLLIENAVKHNIVANKHPLRIKLKITEDEQYIIVENNIQRKIQEVESTGMGLKNIESRIAFFTERPLKVEETRTTFKVSAPLIYSKAKV